MQDLLDASVVECVEYMYCIERVTKNFESTQRIEKYFERYSFTTFTYSPYKLHIIYIPTCFIFSRYLDLRTYRSVGLTAADKSPVS